MSRAQSAVLYVVCGLIYPGLAFGQNYYGSSDPCLPMPPPQNPFAAMASSGVAQQRAEACAAERQAQWSNYYSHQAVVKQQLEAAAAAERERQAQAEVAAQEAAAREKRAQEIQLAEERKEQRDALVARHNEYAQLIALENSPDNECKKPDIARALLQSWSDFDVFKDENLRAIDIEHLTTTAFDASSSTITCHGVFVTNKGARLVGSMQIKKNVAGDPIDTWVPDGSQDLSVYEAPPPLDPDTLRTITVGSQTDAASVAPPADQTAPSFSDGLADRQRWEAWYSGLNGDEKAGATWYAANRSLSGDHDCTAQSKPDDAPWLAGCLNAQQRLTPVDLKRKSDVQYKRGWNSL